MVRRLRREFVHVFLSVGAPPAPISILGLPPGPAWARTHVGPGPLSWGPTWARPWAHPGLGLESAFKVGIIPTRIEQVTFPRGIGGARIIPTRIEPSQASQAWARAQD